MEPAQWTSALNNPEFKEPQMTVIEQLRWKKYPVLNDGHICLVDVMGDDAAIVQAARISYGKDVQENPDFTKKSSDRHLIRYLLAHGHCYTGDMQVLTSNGWKRWDQLSGQVEFLVPDPATKKLKKELLFVNSFDYEGELYCYSNNRMSYRVTDNHTMWFRNKYATDFVKVNVKSKSDWGHFECGANYSIPLTNPDKVFEFIGFFLGDGSFASSNTISFHLKKERKIEYLKSLCLELRLKVRESVGWAGATQFTLDTPAFIRDYVRPSSSAKEKSLHNQDLAKYDTPELVGLLYGLINSDGSHNSDRRGQINFSSNSYPLIHLFQSIASMLRYDCHVVSGGDTPRVTAYQPGRTSLESRKQYHYREFAKCKVYCTTTSTGLLMVRGKSSDFSFVCGNSTPFEMVEFKFRVRVPMDCWRQWVRHRTANINEYSTRYSEAIDSFQTTEPTEWRLQASNNKQGSEGFVQDKQLQDFLEFEEGSIQEHARQVYLNRIRNGIAKEQARKDLPLSTYTESYWKCDLHNIFNFLRLRMDSHAQYEIRMYANAMAEIVKQVVPVAWEAFEDYILYAKKFSRMEMERLKQILSHFKSTYEGTIVHEDCLESKPESMTKREWREFLEKLA